MNSKQAKKLRKAVAFDTQAERIYSGGNVTGRGVTTIVNVGKRRLYQLVKRRKLSHQVPGVSHE